MAVEKFASIPFSQIAYIGIHQNTIESRLTAAQVVGTISTITEGLGSFTGV